MVFYVLEFFVGDLFNVLLLDGVEEIVGFIVGLIGDEIWVL